MLDILITDILQDKEEHERTEEGLYKVERLLKEEIIQRGQEGCDSERFVRDVEKSESDEELMDIYEELQELEVRDEFPYGEPSRLEDIRELRPTGPRTLEAELNSKEIQDKILGSLYGQFAGCQLGAGVECWNGIPTLYNPVVTGCREEIRERLQELDLYPLSNYFPLDIFEDELKPIVKPVTLNNIERVEPNDDLDYTFVNLKVLEEFGLEFETKDVGKIWLDLLPYHRVYTAERNAYRNLVNQVEPPQTATELNPHREFVGARIRAETWGYAVPGKPELAAEFAFRDSRLSHIKNGIYAEMFISAAIAAAFVENDMEKIVEIGLTEIPSNCRLSEAIEKSLSLWREGLGWEESLDRLEDEYGDLHWVHAVNSTALTVASLLWGRKGLEDVITIAVMGGIDTDSDAATAGSIYGAAKGFEAIDDSVKEKWFEPFNNTLGSNIPEFDGKEITEAAERIANISVGLDA